MHFTNFIWNVRLFRLFVQIFAFVCFRFRFRHMICTVRFFSSFNFTSWMYVQRFYVYNSVEIQRNREFYKNADVRPPFTYASLIRQVCWILVHSFGSSREPQLLVESHFSTFQAINVKSSIFSKTNFGLFHFKSTCWKHQFFLAWLYLKCIPNSHTYIHCRGFILAVTGTPDRSAKISTFSDLESSE